MGLWFAQKTFKRLSLQNTAPPPQRTAPSSAAQRRCGTGTTTAVRWGWARQTGSWSGHLAQFSGNEVGTEGGKIEGESP